MVKASFVLQYNQNFTVDINNPKIWEIDPKQSVIESYEHEELIVFGEYCIENFLLWVCLLDLREIKRGAG